MTAREEREPWGIKQCAHLKPGADTPGWGWGVNPCLCYDRGAVRPLPHINFHLLRHFTSASSIKQGNYTRLSRPFYHPFNTETNSLDSAAFNERVLQVCNNGKFNINIKGSWVKALKLIVTNRQLFQVRRIEIDLICSFMRWPGEVASSA